MKTAVKSKTIWFNALSCLLSIGALLKPEVVPIKIDTFFVSGPNGWNHSRASYHVTMTRIATSPRA